MEALITCTGRDGILRTFRCVEFLNENTGTVEYQVYVMDGSTQDFFELVLREVEYGVLQVMMISSNGKPQYKQKGIPDFLLPYVGQKLIMKIQSSPTMNLDKGHWRTPAATKVWERLKDKGIAVYDEQRDIFSIPSPTKPKSLSPPS